MSRCENDGTKEQEQSRGGEAGSPKGPTIDPVFSDAEREELGNLDYHIARLDELQVRGLIAPEVHTTVVAESRGRREAIGLCGRYRSAVAQANNLAGKNRREALEWAERARELDPAREDAWRLIVALEWGIGNEAEALARCVQASKRFPWFQGELARLEAEQVKRAELARASDEQAREERDVKGWLAQVRLALESGSDAEVIALGQQILAIRPTQPDALALMAFAQQRTGQLDAAIESYQALARLQPSNTTWSAWVGNLRVRRGTTRFTSKSPEPAAQPAARGDRVDGSHADEVSAPPPPFSWSSFAGEFLEAHSQELLLCLAVLLIVVSSTVGAHMLLGDLLWSPVGKCTLAMVATLLFAAFGAGLLRWGANRAGRMMLVATLIVVPIHFMLVGEMKLLHQLSAVRLAFLAFEGVALVGMVRWVSGMLAPPAGARFLTLALLLLSVGSAATARGSPMAWGVQFASFQLSPLAFLGAIWALGARRWGDTDDEHRNFVYMMLGLLGFALAACLVRTGAYALRLDAPLYGLPLVVVAISCVHTARRLVAYEPDSQRLALMRFGGYGLSGLAFAVVLASPPLTSVVFSANTLAVAILGFALYVASLRAERHPAFLYLALGAVVAGRLGAHYFLAGRLHAIEEAVRELLGYPDRLPVSFRAILGVIPNMGLAGLSLWFIKYWNDRRLARHCHYIGVPLSIAACVMSGFELLAAVICLSSYALLYLLAIWIFAAPWVAYLAAAALAGACYFGTTLVPRITLSDQALAGALLGFAFWAADGQLRRRHAAPGYRVPWLHAALALTGAALCGASAHLVSAGVGSWTGAGAFILITALAFLLNRERPRAIWAHISLLSFVEFTICGLGLMMGMQDPGARAYGLLFMADGLTLLAVAEGLRSRLNRSAHQAVTDQVGAVVNSRWAATMLAAIPRSAIVLAVVADGMGLLSVDRTGLAGLVFLLGSAVLPWATRLVPRRTLVYLGLAQFVAGTLDLASCAAGWNDAALLAGWLAVTGALLGVAFWAAGVAARRLAVSEFYTEPCFHAAFALMVGGYVVALEARGLGREAYPLAALTLGLNVLVTMLLARTWRTTGLTYVAVFHVVTATYLVLFSVGENDPAMAYVLGLAAAVEAIVLWVIGFACQHVRDPWAKACARPLYHWALVLTCLAVPLSDRSFVVLALVAVSLLLTVKSLPRVEWLYGTVAALAAACYFRWLAQLPRIELVASATLAAFGLWGTAILIQRHKPALCRWLRLSLLGYEHPLFHSSIALALIALALRAELSVQHGIAWTLYGWFPLALAGLSLLMLRAYPHRACVHTSLAFLTWSVLAAVVPWLTSVCVVSLAGLSVALGFLLIERFGRPHEPALCSRLGVIDVGYSPVVRGWALAVFGLAVSLAIVVLVGEMSWAILGQGPIELALGGIDWWAMLATLGLTGIFLMTLGSDTEGWGALEAEHLVVALQWVGVSVLWWLGVRCSPLTVRAVGADIYFPLATAMAGLATARIVRRHTHDESWHELGWLGDLRSPSMGRLLSIQACVLAGLAIAFTKGAIEPATAATLFLSSLSLGMVALASGWQGATLAGSVAWTAAWGVAGAVFAQRFGWGAGGLRVTCASVGVVAAAFSLLHAARWLRRDPSRLKGPGAWALSAGLESPLPVVVAMEVVAFASSLVAVAGVLAAGTGAQAPGGWGTTAGVGVIMAAALLHILLVPRWHAEWLVYLAQAVMLASYVEYRLAFPQSIAFDAIVFTLLGYLDLGIAEALERLDLEIYARPARFFSLLLPSLPLVQLIRGGMMDEISLFHLLAAGTFYGIACGRLRWKTLGYGAAVFYNAGLWVLWSRIGWKLSTHPQFFLVPVGLSTILFAEVNRRELGRSNVNTIRTVGLTIIYFSLAVPIWRYESFGAWVALLIGSLVGVFVGIGLKLQTFLWMGLTTFVLDVIYEMGRVSLDYALAKWAIMLALGIALVMFVALNEKKRIVGTMRLFYDEARLWE